MAFLTRACAARFLPTILSILIVPGFFLASYPETAFAQTSNSRQYQIEAAFLFNFLQFVKWPGTSFSSPDAPFQIGILGDDPFGPALDDTMLGEALDGHRLTIHRSAQLDELMDCQVIFVCRSEKDHIDDILSQLQDRPILTVSEVEDFAGKGGDIDFYLSGDKLRFEINPQSARNSKLHISSQLLALGKIVGP